MLDRRIYTCILWLYAAINVSAESWEHSTTKSKGVLSGYFESLIGISGFTLLPSVNPIAMKAGITAQLIEAELQRFFRQAGLLSGNAWVQSDRWEIATDLKVGLFMMPAGADARGRVFYDIEFEFEQAVRLDRDRRMRIRDVTTWKLKTSSEDIGYWGDSASGGKIKTAREIRATILACAEEFVKAWQRAQKSSHLLENNDK